MRRTVRNERIDYLVADDDPLPHDLKWWAVLRTRAVDELTGEPPLNPVWLVTETPGCLPRIGGDGLCGLVARPRAISEQMLARGELTAEIRAEGYLPRSLTAAIDDARRITTSAMPGDTELTISSADSTPRTQFLPGRGVVLQRPIAGPHSFTLHANPASPPAPDKVPLTDAVVEPRPWPFPWTVVGVPIVLKDQPLHRAQPAVIRGRVMRQPVAGADPEPAPAAKLGLIGTWRTLASIPGSSAPTTPGVDFVAFSAALAFDRAIGTLERHTASVPDGVPRRLMSAAAADATEIELDDLTGLNAAGGNTLELEAANSAEREIVTTAGYTPPSTGTRAVVRLAVPLAFPHAAGTGAMSVSLAFAGSGTLAREAQRGDRVIFASTLNNVATGDVLRVSGGGAPAELRFVRRFPEYDPGTDTFTQLLAIAPDGSFTLPPIARVAQIQLRAWHAGQTAQTIDLAPDYRSDDTTLQILLKP